MFVDKQLELSDSQAVTASALSTNVIDLGAPGIGDLGNADLDVVIQVDTTTVSAGSTTVDFLLYAHTAAAVASGTVIASIPGVAKALLVAGAQFNIKVPRNLLAGGKRYLGLYYTVNTANFSAGAFSAFVTIGGGVQQNIV